MAVRSLSPKRIEQRLREHRCAVRTLALLRAKKAVQAQIRAKGQRLSDYSARDISIRATAWFDAHRDELIAEAEQVIATSPLFAYLRINAQTEKPPISTTFTLQISGAK